MTTRRVHRTLLLVAASASIVCFGPGCGRCPVRPAEAVEPKVELLWPEGAPGAKGDREGDRPTLTVFLPSASQATGAGVVICPGGGYGFLAMEKEGYKVARWLNSLGVAGFVLKYRHRRHGYGHPAPLQDAQRAIQAVRHRAGGWHVDPDRVGILGFSAGGHLASTAGTHFHRGRPDAEDPLGRLSCRPNFMILIYPVVTLVEPYAHRGSRRNLLGEQPAPKLVEHLSNERQVTPDTPPAFLVHAGEDRTVPVENSVSLYLALRKAKVPAEMHVYEKGRHGFGLGIQGHPHASWPERCADWMRAQGLLAEQ